MFHTCAYTLALGTTANTDVPALNDDILAISNSHFLPQRDYDLVYASAMAATLNRARIVSPTNRQITLPFIRPAIAAALPPANPNVANYIANPFRIRGLEELAIEATSDIAMGTERCNVILGLSTGYDPPPRGDVFTLRGTSTTAAVANTWTTITMTWADILPAGTYACLGLESIATNQVASRLIFENQVERPGCLGAATLGLQCWESFQKGKLGVWGRFKSTRMPIVQVLNNSTDAVHTIYMDLVRIAA
jgi:hypothetical protein